MELNTIWTIIKYLIVKLPVDILNSLQLNWKKASKSDFTFNVYRFFCQFIEPEKSQGTQNQNQNLCEDSEPRDIKMYTQGKNVKNTPT